MSSRLAQVREDSPNAGIPGRRARSPVVRALVLAGSCWLCLAAFAARAAVLWSEVGEIAVQETGAGRDLLDGSLKRDDTARDTLYFKFRVNPVSDATTEEYFAAFTLWEGDVERLGIGNALKARAYSAFIGVDGSGDASRASAYVDLRSATPDLAEPGLVSNFEVPRRGAARTIVFKVQYVAGGGDLVTVWLNPDLGSGASELYQPESLITRFSANAAFDEIRLQHAGGGGGWTFSDLAIATSFSDFADTSSTKPEGEAAGVLGSALHFQSWQREQGLPFKSIRALAQTRDGYVWVGGEGGLARFDGVRFATFGERHGWQSGPVSALLCDGHGALWIGTSAHGLSCWMNGRLRTFTARDGLHSEAISALAEDGQGRVWVGTESGLAVWQDGRFITPGDGAGFAGQRISALFADRRGSLWIGVRDAGVFEWRASQLQPLTNAPGGDALRSPHSLLVDQSGRLWIGAGEDLLFCRDGEQWHRYRIPRHATPRQITGLAEEPDGTVWAGSVSEGLFRFKQGKLNSVNASR